MNKITFIGDAIRLNENFFFRLFLRFKFCFPSLGNMIQHLGFLLHPNSAKLGHQELLRLIACGKLNQAITFLNSRTYWNEEHWGTLASALEESGQHEKAIPLWDKILSVPAYRISHGLYLQVLLKRPEIDAKGLLEETLKWQENYANQPKLNLPLRKDYASCSPMRIGFACSFFNSATMKNQFFPWLPHLMEAGHKIFLYGESNFHQPGACLRLNVGNLSDWEYCKLVREDNLDILIETSGFSPGHRFGAMALRCAPRQASYLNHPGPTGIPNVDFNIADDICIAPGEDKFFTEKILRIKNCFFCFNFENEKFLFSDRLPYLDNGFWTFGFFGTGSKLNDIFIKMMADAMNALPGSRLITANSSFNCKIWKEKFIAKFQAAGIDPSRLTVLPGQKREKIAELFSKIDFSFDSYPYCGGNTLSENLWYGVPCSTFCGERFASRYGASILNAVGLSEWIANSPKEMTEIYCRFAKNPAYMQTLRKNIRGTMLRGYSNSRTFAEFFQDGCRRMIEDYQ